MIICALSFSLTALAETKVKSCDAKDVLALFNNEMKNSKSAASQFIYSKIEASGLQIEEVYSDNAKIIEVAATNGTTEATDESSTQYLIIVQALSFGDFGHINPYAIGANCTTVRTKSSKQKDFGPAKSSLYFSKASVDVTTESIEKK